MNKLRYIYAFVFSALLYWPAMVLAQIFGPRDTGSSGRGSDFEPIDDGGRIKIPSFFGGEGLAGSRTFGETVLLILNLFLLVVGSVAVLFLMIGAFRYITAAGSEEAASSAKSTMTKAVAGLVIVVMSFAIVNIVANILLTGSPF